MTAATVVTIFHPAGDPADFVAWADELRSSAADSTDFRISVLDNQHLDWGIAVTFASARALHQWLDSTDRRHLLGAGVQRGILCATSDMVIGDDGGVPAGVGVFRHSVARHRADEFVAAEAVLAEVSAQFSGFEGVCTFPAPNGGEAFAVLRFRTEHQLVSWLESPQRLAALGPLRSSLTREFSRVSSTTTFGSTVRTENGHTAVTPDWKTAMLILLVLYPTVMLVVAVPRSYDRQPRRAALVVDVGESGRQRRGTAMGADAMGRKAIPALARSDRRRGDPHQHPGWWGAGDRLPGDAGCVRARAVAAVLGLLQSLSGSVRAG
ncbi:hypothetical protein [Mycobacterium sp. BK086]|uniref:hypothetical protein n=1 Tax=Mycobacterium sp. BK086 TaxID=2512165 RepID=UPI002570A9BC|nr:hypothetical protein [Mycobacterium sp. BK086]